MKTIAAASNRIRLLMAVLMATIMSAHFSTAFAQEFTVTDLDPRGQLLSGQVVAINKHGVAIGIDLIGNTNEFCFYT